jgi:hypothetical protein
LKSSRLKIIVFTLSLLLLFSTGFVASFSRAFTSSDIFVSVLVLASAMALFVLASSIWREWIEKSDWRYRKNKWLSRSLIVVLAGALLASGFASTAPIVNEGRLTLLDSLVEEANNQCEATVNKFSVEASKSTLGEVFPGSEYRILVTENTPGWLNSDNGEALYIEELSDGRFLVASSKRYSGGRGAAYVINGQGTNSGEEKFQTWFYSFSLPDVENSRAISLVYLGLLEGVAVTDLEKSANPSSSDIYLAYMQGTSGATTLNLGQLSLDNSSDKAEIGLKEIFSTDQAVSPMDTAGSGGRLTLRGTDAFLTVGDLSFGNNDIVDYTEALIGTGDPTPIQEGYGLTYKINLLNGDQTIFTSGHRNPQGLAIDSQGRVWSSEHGPKAGSEINLLEEGQNYGWPSSTLGGPYGGFEPLKEQPGLTLGSYQVAGFSEKLLTRWCSEGSDEVKAPELLLSGNLTFAPSQIVILQDGVNDLFVMGTLAGESLIISNLNTPGLTGPFTIVKMGERIRDLISTTDESKLLFTNDSREIFQITIDPNSDPPSFSR